VVTPACPVTSSRAGPLIVGLVMTLVASACTGSDAGKPSPPPTTTSSSTDFTARIEALIASVNETQDSNAVVRIPARPTVVQRTTGVQTMIMRDEDAGTWPAGTYRLVVRCAGEGVLVAHFSLGDRSVIRQLNDCAATTNTDALELALDRAAPKSVVVLVPAVESMAAVGYQIHKIG